MDQPPPGFHFDPADEPFYDTDDDGFIAPIDALIIINHLNATHGEGETNQAAIDAALGVMLSEPPPPIGRRSRQV